MKKNFTLLLSALFLFCSFIKAQSWSELGGLNGLAANWNILSVCSDASGNIYAAGEFTNGPDHFSGKQYVAKYNGSSWSELGGLNGLAANGQIYSVCSDASGNIYAGGAFYLTFFHPYVAKYNGSSWSELGGLNGLAGNDGILSVCSDVSGKIYATGWFTNSSGNWFVAKYNGSSWSELGGLNGLAANNHINSVCSDASGNIYAAGHFTNSSGNCYVAKYNGSSWSELGGLNGLAANDEIYSICSDASGNIYAAGEFTNSSGNWYVAKYNGSSWSELGGTNGLAANSWIGSVCSDASGNIYAAGGLKNSSGNRYVAKYNGSSWSELGGLNGIAHNLGINSVCSDAYGNIYAAGYNFSNSSGNNYVSQYTTCNVLISPSGPVTFCTGENALLTASPGTAFQWKKNGVSISGATLSSYSAAAGGQYNCNVTTTGCGNIFSNTVTVTVSPLPSAAITHTGSATFCMGDTLVLNAPAGVNKTYQWKKGGTNISGATNSSYAATTGGNYKVTVTNTGTGCSKTTATATVLTANPQPSATITPQGPTTFCAGGSVLLKGNAGTGYTYQWKKGGNSITGATNKNYTATLGGVYKLQVTNTYGCSKLSSGVTVTVPCKLSESESESAFDVKVYPNPSPGDFIFETVRKDSFGENSITEKISVSVYDMVGKLIESGDMNNSRFIIHNSQLSPGVYAATITDGKNKKVLRLIKTK